MLRVTSSDSFRSSASEEASLLSAAALSEAEDSEDVLESAVELEEPPLPQAARERVSAAAMSIATSLFAIFLLPFILFDPR